MIRGRSSWRNWRDVLCVGACVRQCFGFIEQAGLARQLFGTGAELTVARQHHLFDHAGDGFLRFAPDGVNRGIAGHLLCIQMGGVRDVLCMKQRLEQGDIVGQNRR